MTDFKEARMAAYEAAAWEMFHGVPGRWTGSGPGNVTEEVLGIMEQTHHHI